MTLVFDERERLGERPGVHALIAAVSRYSQLGVGRAAALSELELKFPAAVPTANRIRSWLQRAILPVPLATIRLLLSPPRRETSGARGVDSCTLEHFLEEAESWREDALRNRANVTWLYLAGCCLELTYDQIFLFEDFGIGPGALFRKAASIKNLVDGMAPMSDARGIARAQYYFIDARSTSVRELDPLQLQTTTPVFNVPWPSLTPLYATSQILLLGPLAAVGRWVGDNGAKPRSVWVGRTRGVDHGRMSLSGCTGPG